MTQNQVAESAKSADVRALLPAFTFFRENAGYCSPPSRAACALSLAQSERVARVLGWEVTCEDDSDGWTIFGDDKQYYVAVLSVDTPGWNTDRRILATLGGIDVSDAEQPDYWRVIAAELASEAIADNGWKTLAADWTARA